MAILLRLTQSEAYLLRIEMRNCIDCGAEDEDYPRIFEKVRKAISKSEATERKDQP